MPVLAGRALDEDSAPMIALLGYVVSGAVLAGLAGESQFIGRLIRSGSPVGYRWVRVRGCRRCEVGIVAGEVRGEGRRLVDLTNYWSQR
jgi:hypothetical protein